MMVKIKILVKFFVQVQAKGVFISDNRVILILSTSHRNTTFFGPLADRLYPGRNCLYRKWPGI